MTPSPSLRSIAVLVLFALAGPRGAAAPVDSDLGAALNGGGCPPTGIQPALLDMLTLVNPEWAPITTGSVVDSEPVLVHGEVISMHGDTSGDFPATHLRADVNHFVQLDPEDQDRLATGNDDGLHHFEWEAGVYPAWAWAGPGDRLIGLGRWIFDCGHTGAIPGSCSVTTPQQCVLDRDCPASETCIPAHFASSAAPPQPQDLALFGVECSPLAQPVAPLARNFVFDVPLPPRPAGARRVEWRLVGYPAPGGKSAPLRIPKKLADPEPHLHVTVRMKARPGGRRPTGFAGTLYAGWRDDPSPLAHVRLTLDALVVHNALQPLAPVAPKTCSADDAPCTSSADCASGDVCLGVGPVK